MSNLRKSQVGNATLWHSYAELVAFQFPEDAKPTVIQNKWSVTTGKHLTQIDGGDKKNRIEYDEFHKKFREEFSKKFN